MNEFFKLAIEQARLGLSEVTENVPGIPIGAVLVINGVVVGRGHNQRVQLGSAILHAEIDCLKNAGRLDAGDYAQAVLYSTLSPCDMCSGAALLYKIPRIVIGENKTFKGPEEYLRSRGIDLTILQDETCIELMNEYKAKYPHIWNQDIGEPSFSE
ncbi:MAG: nucleoside deaminase [Acidobacteriota bacterium]